ncbi:MAG: hypothetical protein K5925_04880 [Bacilli bacterium]|nr:hypothetical protein [Bacilli bacterium]
MAHARRVIRCHSCGAILQSDNRKLPGFISKNVVENGAPKIPYCNSCYEKMLTLNTGSLNQEVDKEILKILKDAVATDALIIWVVDLFSFNGTLNPDVVKKVKKLDVVVLGTKKDLFPSIASDESLKRFLDERFSELGINPVLIELVGNEASFDAVGLFNKIEKLRKGHDIYLIGNNGSGKTTLINKRLKNFENKTKWPIKTEFYPGTTTNVLEVPLSNSSFLYELPDLSNDTSVVSKVEKEVQKIIVPHKEVVMVRRFIGEGTSIAIGNLAYLSIIKGHHQSVRIFSAEKVETKLVSVAKVDAFMRENRLKHITRPISNRFTSFEDYDLFEYDLEDDDLRHDIAIEGLCWFSMRGKGQTVRVALPKGTALKESLAKIR